MHTVGLDFAPNTWTFSSHRHGMVHSLSANHQNRNVRTSFLSTYTWWKNPLMSALTATLFSRNLNMMLSRLFSRSAPASSSSFRLTPAVLAFPSWQQRGFVGLCGWYTTFRGITHVGIPSSMLFSSRTSTYPSSNILFICFFTYPKYSPSLKYVLSSLIFCICFFSLASDVFELFTLFIFSATSSLLVFQGSPTR